MGAEWQLTANISATISDGPEAVQEALVRRFKSRRLALDLSQEGLARRAGITMAALKHFEHKGQIALNKLLKLALVLDCLGDFALVCSENGRTMETRSLDDILAESKTRRRGRLK
jgi:transcriptional regulator with XRE-family HTH domain